MIRICVIGSCGHYGEALDAICGQPGRYMLCGLSPGFPEENMSGVIKAAGELRPALYEDYASMIKSEKPDIAVVCSRFDLNAEISAYGLERGIHIFSEKPLAINSCQFQSLEKAMLNSKSKLSAMLTTRYEPHFLAAYNAIRAGEIGGVSLIQAQKSYKLGLRPDFFKKRCSYGGTIPWVGIHAIDWIRWLSGEEFESVYASHFSDESTPDSELEISATACFTLTNHVHAVMSCDYLRPVGAPTHDDDRVRVVGTRGILEVRSRHLTVLSDEGERYLSLPEKLNIFDDFVRYACENAMTRLSAEDSMLATKAALLTRKSADLKRIVYFGSCYE